MESIELKIGHRTVTLTEKDIILDNGAIYQVVTQKVFSAGSYSGCPLVMSKKLFKDLKSCGLIYTDRELEKLSYRMYGMPNMILYKFDIAKMKEMGY